MSLNSQALSPHLQKMIFEMELRGYQHFSLYHGQTIDFTGTFTDFKSVSNSEFYIAFVRHLFLLKSEGKRG